MRLSVIIPVHNEEFTLGAQLDALLAQEIDGDWEIIVVDNASTDKTADLVWQYAERSKRVRLLIADKRADRSYALNEGIAAGKSDSIAVCDGDDIVALGWVAAMVDGLTRFDVVTGPNELDALNPPWLAASRGRSAELSAGSFWGIFPMIRGNNFGVTRATWSAVGGLNESYRFCEDAEFSFRCWKRGFEIVGLPTAAVHYRYRDNERALWRQGIGYGAGRPQIARLLRDNGGPTPPHFGGWKSWLLLLIRIPTVVTRTGRATWIWIAANRCGQVVGSIRHRTIML